LCGAKLQPVNFSGRSHLYRLRLRGAQLHTDSCNVTL